MADQFTGYSYGLESPAANAFAIAPSDGADLAYVTRGIYVGGAGDVKVNMGISGSSITFSAVPAGTVLPIRAARILATGTTATLLVGLY